MCLSPDSIGGHLDAPAAALAASLGAKVSEAEQAGLHDTVNAWGRLTLCVVA